MADEEKTDEEKEAEIWNRVADLAIEYNLNLPALIKYLKADWGPDIQKFNFPCDKEKSRDGIIDTA